MNKRCLNNFDTETFLKEFWQRKALFIEQAIPGFISPLDPNDLAGLSLEESAESRLILEQSPNKFSVECGPFAEDSFEFIEAENWSLLVQAVDHWLDEINDLKGYFDFLPSWRLDDIMISYAPTGGSVGPHFDQYDVFLLQASGERRWQLGQACDDNSELVPGSPLKILKHFNEENAYLCKAGDILYVPPGKAHWGVSESDDCMTISIGFRAPSAEEIASELLHNAADTLTDGQRFTDPKLKQESSAHQIKPEDIQQIRQLLNNTLLNDENILNTFGKMMSEPKYPEQFTVFAVESGVIRKRPDSRLAYFANANSISLFANGQRIETAEDLAFIEQLCSSDIITNENLTDKQCQLIGELIDLGIYEDVDCD
jgi:50S ribosomal protein L16 3-hydroxylase